MALFGLKGFKKKKKHVVDQGAISKRAGEEQKKVRDVSSRNTEKKEKKMTLSAGTAAGAHEAAAILHPRVTEKATYSAEKQNAYIFDVASSANKHTIASAVRAVYGVTPVKVHTLAVPRKTRFIRGRFGMTGGGKKAVVYLKKGDKIETN